MSGRGKQEQLVSALKSFAPAVVAANGRDRASDVARYITGL